MGPDRLSNVDEMLRAEIRRSTEGDVHYWSSPDRDLRDSVHALFQYPGMMIPAVQRNLISVLVGAQPGIKRMLDPFVGAGTTLTAGMALGLDCYGQDVNPLAVLLSLSKSGPFYCKSLAERTCRVIEVARADNSEEVDVRFPNLYKWFREDVAVELSRLRRAIKADGSAWARRFMWVTLAETIRRTSNDRTSTYKLHARPRTEIAARELSPVNLFSSLVQQNLTDLARFKEDLERTGHVRRGRYTGTVCVELGDSTTRVVLPKVDGATDARYDLLVTSAPYGDNGSTITYGQHSYLPLQWVDLEDIDPRADQSVLRTTQEIDRRSLGGVRSRNLRCQIESLSSASVCLARTLRVLSESPRDRVSRVAAFYTSLQQALDQIVDSLMPNAYMLWTIGNRRVGGIEIPNDRILTELLDARSVDLVTQIDRRIHQKRMPTRNPISGTMNQERILIFRKCVATGNAQ